MPDYTVTSRIQGDRLYESGETITLSPKEAKELAILGAINPKPLKATRLPKAGEGSNTEGSAEGGQTQEPDEEGKTGETAQ